MKCGRLYNFSAGPANLPEPVLERARDEMLNFGGSGMSVLEMSHRSKAFDEIFASATSVARELMGIPDTHEVLFLQGGASLQFSMAPMNFYQAGKPIDMIHTGYWSGMAVKEAKKAAELRMVYSGDKDKFMKIPEVAADALNPAASYVYLCSNNTIEGTQFKKFPRTGTVPLVADMSSDYFSRPVDVSQFGLIFGGAQKNLGPSGVVLAILRKDLADRCPESVPTMLQYRTHVKNGSRYNTPPTYSIYICWLVMEWIKELGGLAEMEKVNARKAKLVYDAIDQSGGFYHCPVETTARSPMNLVWRIKPGAPDQEQLEETFVREAKAAGLLELKGHRSVGGLRASLYNAHPMEGAQALSDFMREFRKQRG